MHDVRARWVGACLGSFELAGVLGWVVRRRGLGGLVLRGTKEVRVTLKIYPVVVDLVRRLAPMVRVLRSRSSVLGDQMERALVSIPLNVAEGAYSRGRNRQARYQSALASAREVLACLETADAMGFIRPIAPELAAQFHHIIGTLVRLVEPRR